MHECMHLCAYMMCVLCVSMYSYMEACVCINAHTVLCLKQYVVGVTETCRLVFLKFTSLCVCESFIRTTMKVQLDTEIAIQI